MDPEIELTFSERDRANVPESIAPRESLRARIHGLLRAFSPSERLMLYILSIALGVSAFLTLANVNVLLSTEVPTRGGSLTEGGAGTPRFINPLLAASDPDHDLTTLVYSGLLRATLEGGYIPDLAEAYEISDDGTVYTFHLRSSLTFHDGTPLTSADVLFTIALAQNPEIKSTRRADWEGVDATAPDDYTIIFTLPYAYAPFRENATIGILPKHVWENIPAEEFPFSSLNTYPVGSGPYHVHNVVLDSTGAPTEYRLNAFNDFALDGPYIGSITYRAYQNETAVVQAYENGDIDSFVAAAPKLLPSDVRGSQDAQRIALARVFGIFLNQNHAPLLTEKSVRAALRAAVDKNDAIEKVLGGYGTVLDGPVPPGLLEQANTSATTSTDIDDHVEAARKILTAGGWKFDTAASAWKKDTLTLTLTLATADTEELALTARLVADAWIAAGIPTSVQIYPLQEFNTTILRPRAYDAILFGEVVGPALDLYAFWHSSQRNDPGLNLALYTNTQADKTLEAARAEIDDKKRREMLREFVGTLDKDVPAVFIYSPQIAYIVPSRFKGVDTGTIASPSDRFVSIHLWYRDTERVWNVFNK